MRRWRVLQQREWRALGAPFPLGAGYYQTVRIARGRRRCDEPGCGQLIAPGELFVDYWMTHGYERHETFCLAHAPVAIELSPH